jgi:S-adenosylmethionine hydrolase
MRSDESSRICGMITDFGNQDYFIGTLRGVMKKINPFIDVVDITNDIPSYQILPACFVIEQTYPYFPKGSIFLVVVDPGVGTSRRILLVKQDGYFFIAPDNGVLTPILLKKEKRVSQLNNSDYFLIEGNSTFEARDKMAPVAAYLSGGVDPKEMSTPTDEYILAQDYHPLLTGRTIKAKVAYIDKFGNVMTHVSENFLKHSLKESGLSHFKVEINGKVVSDFYSTYGEASSGVFMLIGSHQNLEIAMNQNSASAFLGIQIGQELLISFY